MDVKIRNIGIIKEADLKLDGITVITGINDSGKSSVGKALFSLGYGISSYENNIDDDAMDYISEEFYQVMKMAGKIPVEENFENILSERAGKRFFIRQFSFEHVENELKNLEEDMLDIPKVDEFHEKIKILREKIERIRSSNFRSMVRKRTVNTVFLSEFEKKINNVFSGEKGVVELRDNDDISLGVAIVGDEIKEIYGSSLLDNDKNELFSEVSLINTPLIIDDLRLIQSRRIFNHKSDILAKLSRADRSVANIIESAEQNEIQDAIELEFRKVLKGNIIHKSSFFYEDKGERFSLSSLASGMKSYAVIKLLLDNGYLKNNSLLIIDEPEVHLHPEWQLLFAELLFVLNKKLKVKLLLATHSPYFLQALEVFSKKYDLQKDIHFYLSQREDVGTVLHNIDDNLEATYKLMAKPIQYLQSLHDAMED